MAEAADLLRHVGDLDRERMIFRRECRGDLLENGLVFADETPLHPALPGIAEHVDERAAQAPQPRQDLEDAKDPPPIGPLAQLAGCGIARGKQRRSQMKLQPEVALELLAQVLQKPAVGIEPRHFVFVLVGHQLEQIVRGGFGKPGSARCPRFRRLLDCGDRAPVALGIAGALVTRQELGAVGDDVRDGWLDRRLGPGHRRPGQRLDLGAVVGGQPAPGEGALVGFDRDPVELDRPLDRL